MIVHRFVLNIKNAQMKKQFVFTSLLFFSIVVFNNTLSAFTDNAKEKSLTNLSISVATRINYYESNPERIYHHVDKNSCAEWEITKNIQIKYDYERAKEIKEDGVFYYHDDENEMIQTQNYLPDGQVLIKNLFWYQGVCHIISVISCKQSLVENKKTIKSLHLKIISGQL